MEDLSARIYIYHAGKLYCLMKIGYSSDGGYWITDLADKENFDYILNKIEVCEQNTKMKVLESYFLPSPINPKLSHHFDGNAHISGDKILSGFQGGLSIHTFPLGYCNDGGPIFTLDVGLGSLKHFHKRFKTTKKGIVLNRDTAHDMRTKQNEEYNYIIEGYYFPKKDLPQGFRYFETTVKKMHPSYGLLNIIFLPSPENSPGVIGIAHIIDTHMYAEEKIVFIGAPGAIDKHGCYKLIEIELVSKGLKHSLKNLKI